MSEAVALASSSWVDTDIIVRLRRGAGGVVRAEGVLCRAPVWYRWDGATLWMVGSGASPVGEDHIRVSVDVGPGVTAAVRSVGATMVYAARGAGTRWVTDITVAEGASLDWRPEPVIVTERARHEASMTVRAAASATVTIEETIVLGRTGERGGAICAGLHVRVDDHDVLRTSFDSSIPGAFGPGGVDDASVVAQRLRLGGDPSEGEGRLVDVGATHAVRLEPGDGCELGVAVAAQVHDARRALDGVVPR